MNCRATPAVFERELIFQRYLQTASDHPNSLALAQILSSWHSGHCALPEYLGLSALDFDALRLFHFDLYDSAAQAQLAAPAQPGSGLDLRLSDIRDDLLHLLRSHARDASNSTRWVAELIATACLGSRHLWEDLGVFERARLSALLQHNFPQLAARNTRDMKWKKFLFKQLCETEGIYICRAPCCDDCSEFSDCFGPE